MSMDSWLRAAAFVGVAVWLANGAAQAQQGLRIEPSVGVVLTATDNANIGSAATQRDRALVLEVRPRLALSGQSARIRANGEVGLQMLTFARTDRPSRTYPEGRLESNLTLVERWLFVDADFAARHAATDPFSLQSGETPSSDGRVTYRYRFSPYVYRELTPSTILRARTDKSWTRLREDASRGAPEERSDLRRHSASFELRPEPLGGLLEVFDESSSTDATATSSLQSRGARVVATYALSPELTLGASVGRERSEIDTDRASDATHGWRLRWTPSERALFEAQAERRYFGWGGSGNISLRSPFFAWSVEASRAPVVQGSPLLFASADRSLSATLDAIFSTRYPDPAQREVVVRDLISNSGLDENTVGAIDIFPDYAQLQSRLSTSVLFTGRLTTVRVGWFFEKGTLLRREDQAIVPVIATNQDSLQRGVSLATSRRLSPDTSANIDLAVREIVGLGDAAGQRSKESSITTGARVQVGPRSELTAGLRYRVFRSNTIADSNEKSAFVGANHRF